MTEEEVEDWYLDKDAVKRSFKEFKTIVLNTHGQSGLLAELNKLADKFGLEECEKCGDDDCADGEKCGLKESKKRRLNEDDFESAFRFAKEDLQEWYPNATEEQIETALNSAYGDHNRVVNAFERNDPTVANIWAEVASECLDNILKEAKNPYDDVDEETDSEIREIIDEDDDRSDTEKEISEYERVEDDVDEDDDVLSESVIRHATMLAREIW